MIRPFVPQSTLQLIFKTLVQPHLDYCSVAWGSCGITLSIKLQKLQNRAARVLTFSKYDADTEPLIETLGWKKLSVQRQIQTTNLVYKSLKITPCATSIRCQIDG